MCALYHNFNGKFDTLSEKNLSLFNYADSFEFRNCSRGPGLSNIDAPEFRKCPKPGPRAVTSNLRSPESSCRKGGNSLFWKNFRTFLAAVTVNMLNYAFR
jgi:hypothetical protein